MGMRRSRIWVACLLAGLAVCAAATTATASAAGGAEFYECLKGAVGSGKYSDKECKTLASPGKGKYELKPGIGKKHTFKGETVSGHAFNQLVVPSMTSATVVCQAFKDKGTNANTTEQKEVTVAFTGCELESSAAPCNSAKAKTGEVKSAKLKGVFGIIEKRTMGNPLVGDLLSPETGTTVTTISCGPGLPTVIVKGTVIASMTGVNAFTKDRDVSLLPIFGEEGHIEQQYPESFEGEAEKHSLIAEIPGLGSAGAVEFGIALEKGELLDLKA
jgi:hypothetical protein